MRKESNYAKGIDTGEKQCIRKSNCDQAISFIALSAFETDRSITSHYQPCARKIEFWFTPIGCPWCQTSAKMSVLNVPMWMSQDETLPRRLFIEQYGVSPTITEVSFS